MRFIQFFSVFTVAHKGQGKGPEELVNAYPQ